MAKSKNKGKPFRSLWWLGDKLLSIIGVATVVFLYFPILILIIFSFNSISSLSLPIKGLTFKWYQDAFSDPTMLQSLMNSLKVGFLTAVTSTILGTIGAYGLARRTFRGKSIIQNLAIVPMTIPSLLLGVALLIFYERIGLPKGILTIAIGHITFCLPFVIVIVTSRFAGFDVSIEEAARDLGATGIKAFWYVTLPMILPAVIAGGLMAFTLSLDDFIVAFMTTGSESTLPLYIWSRLRYGLSLKVNALATVIMLFSFIMIIFVAMMIANPFRKKSITKLNNKPG